MTKRQAQKYLFVAIAAAVVMFFQREQFASWAYRALKAFDPPYTSYDSGWGSYGMSFFEDRWALMLVGLVIVYFAYRVVTAPPDPPGS